MRLWLLLIGVFIIQEIAATNVTLLAAYHAGYSPYIIAGIFVLATLLDLAIGYAVGKYVQKRFGSHPWIEKIERSATHFEQYLGPWSERLLLVLIGLVSYVYVNAFLAAWLKLPPREALLWVTIGDLLWYGLEWLLVLGTTSITTSFTTELYIGVGSSLVLIVGLRLLSRRVFKS